MRVKTIVTALALTVMAGAAFAQPYYLTGGFTTNAWSPGSGVPPGTGDATSLEFVDNTDGTYTLTITEAELGLTPGDVHEFKVATSGFGSAAPNNNAKFIAPQTGNNLVMTLDTNTLGDGYVHDAGGPYNGLGIVYANTTLDYVTGASSVQAAGAFQDENGGAGDWDPSDASSVITLTDQGGGIYSGSITGLPDGSYDFKITVDGVFGADFGQGGLGGDNLNFTVIDPSNTVTITLDANKSRVKIENPALTAGPPWYAQSSAWGEGFNSVTVMTEIGDDTFRRTFVVPTPGEYGVRVRDALGTSYPDSNNYPFTTTAADQEVLVVFDTNIYADGFIPETNIVTLLNESDRTFLNDFETVQPVGTWQSEFGGPGDNDNNVAAMVMSETVAGSEIWTKVMSELDGATITGAEVKAIGVRTGNATDAGNRWNVQMGGVGEGLTVGGDNQPPGTFDVSPNATYEFKVDTVTGRVGVAETTIADPTRGPVSDNYFTPGTSNGGVSDVEDWMMY